MGVAWDCRNTANCEIRQLMNIHRVFVQNGNDNSCTEMGMAQILEVIVIRC